MMMMIIIMMMMRGDKVLNTFELDNLHSLTVHVGADKVHASLLKLGHK